MPRGGAHFSSQELAQILSHYDLGVIHQLKPLTAGNRRAPKMIIFSEKGKFLLKRRPKGKDDLYHVAFAHAVQMHLAEKDFPISRIVLTIDDKNTILRLDNHIYELFKFVKGIRYDGADEATEDAGRQLARFHNFLADFACEWKPLRTSFHDSTNVRRYMKTIAGDKKKSSHKKLQKVAENLMGLYNNASIQVNELGFDSWPVQVVHGDWHPGNMLFAGNKIAAVLDFDSIKIAPPVTDLANAMLQFSIVGNRPNPADWPDYFDQKKLLQLLNGYHKVKKLDDKRLNVLIDLMIETMIAEAVLPIATTGFFTNLAGFDFLAMIQRKAEWLAKNRLKLISEIVR